MKIIIPGGSGQIGQVLARAFLKDGHEVVILARGASGTKVGRVVEWDGRTAGRWTRELEGADVVINLAGYSVDCRYNEANRKRIMDSRVDSTRILGETIPRATNPPAVWLNASTATIYRHALDRDMDEIDGELGGGEPGAPDTWRFSISVAKAWEETFFAADTPRTRKVALRSAMTMSPDRGGVFDVLLRLTRMGLGGTIGSGNQYVSWIHDRDFVRAVKFLIERADLEGCINVCSPNPLSNREFMAAIRKAWGMPVGLPAMEWMIEVGTFVMRTESELVLKSRRVVPRILMEAGFTFEFPHWPDAVRNLCERVRAGEGR